MSSMPAQAETRHGSVWLDDEQASGTRRAALDGELRVDVAVVGAGITGLTTALLLARGGRSVAVVDQSGIGSGTTSHSTAKVTSQHGLTYAELAGRYGEDAARIYGRANEDAKERVAGFVEEGIECGFRRRDAYVYAASESERKQVEEEAEAARLAGLPAAWSEDVPLPYPVHGAVVFSGQAEFDPQRYLEGLAGLLEREHGRIFERTRATGLAEGAPCELETERGRIEAEHVVIATLMPMLDRGGLFARAYPTRSYVVTASLSEPPPEAMLISAGAPVRSIRSVPWRGEELLMLGGESHHVGSTDSGPARYGALVDFGHRHWRVREITHRWSSQDYSPADGVPYVGRLHPFSRALWTATGFKKWGITGGTAAAALIADGILGRRSRSEDEAGLFSATRLRPRGEGPAFLKENSKVGLHFVGDRLRHRPGGALEDLAPGQGGIVNGPEGKVAGYRDGDGGLHAVSTRCTHLYCQVNWNAAEHSWDCPCHGSRFAVDGEVLNGPATSPLPKRRTS